MKKIVIIGATSAIASACGKKWATAGAEFFLVARDLAKLDLIKADLVVRGAKSVTVYQMDLTDITAHQEMLAESLKSLHQIDIVLFAAGTLPDQSKCENSPSLMLKEVNVNAVSVMALLTIIANQLQLQRCGNIAVISSVAGDRGRPSNYVYGSAKAALSTFCEGLRARMFKYEVYVTDIKPGFVDTPMTRGLELPTLLLSSPDKVASIIVKGISKKRNVLYVPGYWWFIMQIIKYIPQFIFKKLDL